MRTLLNHTIKSNIDLSKLSNKRVKIEALGNGKFHFTSDTISMPKHWAHGFIFRFLDRRLFPPCILLQPKGRTKWSIRRSPELKAGNEGEAFSITMQRGESQFGLTAIV